MALNLFGFVLGKTKQEETNEKNTRSFVPPNESDSAINLYGAEAFGTPQGFTLSEEGHDFQSENILITKYREIALIPEVDYAIEEIVSEAICSDDHKQSVSLNLDSVKMSESGKKKIREGFDHVLNLLNFKQNGHTIFRRWYIDGRLFYHNLIDETNPKKGIIELRYIDPRRIKKVRLHKNKDAPKYRDHFSIYTNNEIEEFYVYNKMGVDSNASLVTSELSGIQIQKDSITYVNSGLYDPYGRIVLSHLHKSLRVSNNLRMLEDSMVIYRLTRAPERRIFYIDVGNLPKGKSEAFMNQIMTKYKNKMVYDVKTGEIRDDRKHLAMTEDYWIPRRDGRTSTEIDTLPGGENLGETGDLDYFRNNLYNSLNVPKSRFNQESPLFGKGTETSREEIRFSKFVNRLRTKFVDLFDDILSKHLILTNVVTKDEWEDIKQYIYYDFVKDSYFQEAFELDVLKDRLASVQMMEPYLDKLFSKRYIQKNILMQTDEQIEEIEKQISNNPFNSNEQNSSTESSNEENEEQELPPPEDSNNP